MRLRPHFLLFALHLLLSTVYSSWTYKQPLNFPRADFVCEVFQGKIYVIGGRNQWQVLGVCEEYDPQLDTWIIRESMPTPRYNAVSGVVGSKIYVIGGDTSLMPHRPLTKIIEAYDPQTNTWERINSFLPTPRSEANSFVISDWIYVLGGKHRDFFTDTVERYNPILSRWEVKKSMLTSRGLFSAARQDGKGYVLGGYYYGPIRQCEVYDTVTNTWCYIKSLPRARYYSAAASCENKIFILGGKELRNEQSFASKTVYYYVPAQDSWVRYSDLNRARYGLGVAVISQTLYAIGGADSTGYLGIVEKTTFVSIEEEPKKIEEVKLTTYYSANTSFVNNKNWIIFDVSGKRVNASHLKRGVYFLLSKETRTGIKKIIVY